MSICDICGAPGTGTMVSAEQIREAVFLRGFNPFELGLASNMAAFGLQDEESFVYWKNTIVSQDTSDWNVCSKCLEKLRPYLSGDPEPTGVRKAKISSDPAAGIVTGAKVEKEYEDEKEKKTGKSMPKMPRLKKVPSGSGGGPGRKRRWVILLILLIVLGAAGAWLSLGKGLTPMEALQDIQKVASQRLAGLLGKHPAEKVVVVKERTVKRPVINWEELFAYVPVDPARNYVVAAADLEGLLHSMDKRLSVKDRVAARVMALKSGVAVAWPKEGTVSSKDMHYAIVCSTKGNMVEIRKRLFENSGMEIIEGTCGVGTECYQMTLRKSFLYLAFKGDKHIMVSDDPDILDAMARGKPDAARGRKWCSILRVERAWLGAFLVRTEETSRMAPSFMPYHNLETGSALEYISIAGHLQEIAKGFSGEMHIMPYLKSGDKIEVAEVTGEWDVSPRLPSGAVVWGMDLDALRKSVEPVVKKLSRSGKGDLGHLKGRIFSEVAFNGQRPLFYLKGTGFSEESPILARLGRPGNKIDVTSMSPMAAMILGKTTIVREKGGFTATNIYDWSAFKTSSKGLDETRDLMSDALKSQPMGFVCISPVKLAKGAAFLLKPFFSQNPESSKSMQKLEEAEHNPSYAKKVAVLVKSPLSYKVLIEFE